MSGRHRLPYLFGAALAVVFAVTALSQLLPLTGFPLALYGAGMWGLGRLFESHHRVHRRLLAGRRTTVTGTRPATNPHIRRIRRDQVPSPE